MRWLFDLRSRYGYHGSLLLGSHWVITDHNNRQISVVDTSCFLGIIFDRKLTFIPHILSLRKKFDKTLNILKVLSNTTWGADCISMLKIYRSLIRSKLDYACQMYGSTCNTYLKKLDTVHLCDRPRDLHTHSFSFS